MTDEEFELARENIFMKNCGFTLERDTDGNYFTRAQVTPEIQNQYGMVHGGLMYSMADTITGVASWNTGNLGVTLNSSFSYLSNVSKGVIIGKAENIRVGNSIGVFRAIIQDESGNLLAEGTFTYYFMKEVSK